MLFRFCLGIFGESFLIEELLDSTSYKYSQVSNSDVPVISSIGKVYAPFFCVCAYYGPLAREYDIRDIFKVTKIKVLHRAENTCQT